MMNMKTTSMMVSMVVGLALLAGCGAQKGTTRVKFEKGHDLQMTKAPRTAEYALYTMTDVTPQIVQKVNEGDRLGFERTEDGKTRAVAGTYTTTLPDSTREAYWKEYVKD
jgi:hypothetical protein